MISSVMMTFTSVASLKKQAMKIPRLAGCYRGLNNLRCRLFDSLKESSDQICGKLVQKD